MLGPHQTAANLEVAQLSSLEILKPEASEYEKTPLCNKQTTLLLERRCRRLIQLVAEQDWENPDFERLMAPNFLAFLPHSDVRTVRSRAAYIENYKSFFASYPEYRCEILDLTVYADDRSGRATVWMHFSVHGHPTHLERESITIGHWRKWNRGWIAVKQTGMRGFGGNL